MSERARAILATLGEDDSGTAFRPGTRPGRVSIVHGATAEVIWVDERDHEVISTCQFASVLNLSPVAGDWVSILDGYVVEVCERRTALRRPHPNRRDVQILAANLDLVLVVVPIDRELNLLMLERLAVMAFDSGAQPIVVLTKTDDAEIVDAVLDQARAAVRDVEILTTSSKSGLGIDELRTRLHQGVTAVMLGASGAGKTSLLNALEDRSEMTRSVSRTGEGRHATTTRRLYRLSSGGVLLDIPGIRLLDLMVGPEGIDEAFADLAALAEECRFADCAHQGDDGCAVEQAVAHGELSERRLASWRTARAGLEQKSRMSERSANAKRRNSSERRRGREDEDED